MTRTREGYGSGIARPKVKEKYHFELKGQFLKELRDNTFSGLDNEDANENIEKVLKIVDLFHIPNIIQDQEVISFYKGLDVPTRQILDSKGTIPSMKALYRSTENSDGLAAIRAQLNNVRREIKKVNEKVNHGASIKALENQIGQMSKVMQEKGSRNLPSSTETNPRDYLKSISTTVEANIFPIRHIRPSKYVVSAPQNKDGSYGLNDLDAYSIGTTLLEDALPPKEKDPWSITLPCYINNLCLNKALADLGDSVSVMPLSTYTNLRLGKLAPTKLIVELADRTVKHPKGIEENFLCMIGYEHVNANFFLLLSINVMPKIFYYSIIKGKVEFKGKNVVGAFMNVPIFVGNFSVITDFAVVENTDSYRDKGMGDVIVGRPFYREACVKARRFDGMITIHKGLPNGAITPKV
ncbi:DNA/RNA polymerases superfamily protein [Tanacetum coccineum]